MSIQTTIAQLATVDFKVASNTPIASGASVVVDGVTIASLTAAGLLSYMPALCSVLAIANGATVNAIRPLYEDGSIYSATDIEAAQSERVFRPVLLRAADGGVFTLAHNSAPPVDEWTESERIIGQFGRDVTVGSAWAYVQWDKVGGARRWRAADWGGYVPSVAAQAAITGSPSILDLKAIIDALVLEVATLKGSDITV